MKKRLAGLAILLSVIALIPCGGAQDKPLKKFR